MKIYNRKTLFVTVFAGGAGLIYSIVRLLGGDLWGAAWILIFAVMIIQGLSASLTQKGFEKDAANARKSKKARQALFGRFASVMPYGALLCFCAAACCIRIFPERIYIGLCFIAAAPIYQLWLLIAIRKEIEKGEVS